MTKVLTKWDRFFMSVALQTAQLSYCKRLRVGSVAVFDKRIISCGYNGTPSGLDNCCEDSMHNTKPEVIHAEENMILFCAKHGIKLNGCQIYITHAPCINCAKLIYSSGIAEVYYNDLYRSGSGIAFLESVGVKVEHLNAD